MNPAVLLSVACCPWNPPVTTHEPSMLERLERFVAVEAESEASPSASPALEDVAVEPFAVEPLATEAVSRALEAFAPAESPLQFASAQRQGSRTSWAPKYWLSVGGHYVSGSYDTPNDFAYDENTAFSLDLGIYNWRGEMGIGLEAGMMLNDYELEGDAVGSGAETVDVWRGMVGLRIADRGPDDGSFIPYVRAGFMYRRDDGDTVKDDGIGWYAALGFDWRFGSSLAIGPSVMYTEASSQNAREWLGGLLLTLAF